jgi:NTP pyrophosphatase (non-canonical NTP hydrolase)
MADRKMIEQFDDSPTMATYQEIATTTQIYPREHAVFYPALGLAGEAGEVANKIKKIMRDTKGDVNNLPGEVKDQIASELGDCLWYISALATDLGIGLDGVAFENIKKLDKRKEQGTIHGTGDDR